MPVELSNPQCRAVIYPEMGGMVNNVFVRRGTSEVDIIYGYANVDQMRTAMSKDFRSAKLSPYPNRIKGGKYEFQGEMHALELNFLPEDNSIHGLLFNKPFRVKQQHDQQLTLVYQVQKNQFPGYPFSYTIELDYTLLSCGLKCTTRIENQDTVAIPMADGFHPYFRIGDTIADIALQLPTSQKMELDQEGIPTLNKVENSLFQVPELLDEVTLDDCFELDKTNIGEAKTVLQKGGLTIVVKQQTGENKYNFLQVYTPPNRKSIAIEPMTCAPNSFNNKLGLLVLEAGEKIEMAYECEVILE